MMVQIAKYNVVCTGLDETCVQGGYVYQARLSEHGDRFNICIGSDCFRYKSYPLDRGLRFQS
jgi:hypothetical protein